PILQLLRRIDLDAVLEAGGERRVDNEKGHGERAAREAQGPCTAADQSVQFVPDCRIVRVKILVSNDDGYFAPGITLLAEALRRLGQGQGAEPERDRSGASNSLTLDRPLVVRRAPNGYYSVNGTPTDCVHIAVTGLPDFTPDVTALCAH